VAMIGKDLTHRVCSEQRIQQTDGFGGGQIVHLLNCNCGRILVVEKDGLTIALHHNVPIE